MHEEKKLIRVGNCFLMYVFDVFEAWEKKRKKKKDAEKIGEGRKKRIEM